MGGVILTPWMLQIMSVPDEVYGRAFVYTTIYFGGIWSMILYNMTAGILRAYGDSKRPLYVLVCCAVINILRFIAGRCVEHGSCRRSTGNRIFTDRQRGCYLSMLKRFFVWKKGRSLLVALILQRTYAADAAHGVSAGIAVDAVPHCKYHCTGGCQYDGYGSDCSMGYL